VVAVNKADGERAEAARRTSAEFESAFRLLRGAAAPAVLPVSARERTGIAELWREIERCHGALEASGELAERRRQQRKAELRERLSRALLGEFTRDPGRRQALAEAELEVMAGTRLAREAVQRLLHGDD